MQKGVTYAKWLYFIHASTLFKRTEWHEHTYFEDSATLLNKKKKQHSVKKKSDKDNSEQSIVVFSEFTTMTSTSVQILSMKRTRAGTN